MKIRRRLFSKIIALPLASFLLLSACTKKVDMQVKEINLAQPAKVKGMDPISSNDLYSASEVGRVYEGLLEYHYLKRPFVLIPNLAESLPTVSEDGLTYTFQIKKGVLFHDDPAFPNGVGREMVAQDFVYSILRSADPNNMALGWWLLDDKLAGVGAWREESKKNGKADYNAPIEGLKALDNYTLQFKLTRPYPQFLYALAMPFYYVVPKEAVEKYGNEFVNHPVGTGPFTIQAFNPQMNKLVYEKNTKFRTKLYPTEASEEFIKRGFLEDAGKQLPLADRLVVHIMPETQPIWLNFQKAKLDVMAIPKDNFDAAVTPNNEPTKEMQAKGMVLNMEPGIDLTYVSFNHAVPLFKNKKLRQAMAMAYDIDESNRLFFNGKAINAQSIIPPGLAGYEKDYVNPYLKHDIAAAKKLLAEAGYPEGKGLPEIPYDTLGQTVSRQMAEFFVKSMQDIGIKIQIVTNTWPELQKKISLKMTQLHGIAWSADYPDAENFLQLMYGPNAAPGSNGSNYDDPTFNALYEKAAVLQDSPERTALYQQMSRYLAEEMPIIFMQHRKSYILTQKWFKNYIYSDFAIGNSQYYNVNLEEKAALLPQF